ncbi:MAG TPA: integration host factor subunit alpha [Azonexus sp.]|nr:integration host factor subunit alpha [Azonexus sp.]
MATLTKAELATRLVDEVGLNQREAKEMVELFFHELSDALEAGDEVKLAGFGVFSLRDKPERPGRNPKTGEETPITARRVVTWHPSGNLKDAIDTSPRLSLNEEEAA